MSGLAHERAVEHELAERQRLLLASLPDSLIVLYDREMRCVMLEGEILASLGIDPALYIGRPIQETLPAAQVEVLEPLIRQALDGQRSEAEYPSLVDGRLYHVDVAPYRLDDGTIAGAFAVGRDITEFREAQEKLKLFRTIVQQSDDAIVVRSPEGLVTEWNDGAQRLFGYTKQEMLGRTADILEPPDRAGEEAELLQRACDGEVLRQLHTRRVNKDGTTVDVSMTVSPIFDKDGASLGASTIAHDITAQMRAQRRLLNSERQLFDAQALAHVGSWERDLSEERPTMSAELCRILGQRPGYRPTNDEFAAQIHPEDRERVTQELLASVEGESSESEYRIIRPDGEIRYVRALRHPRTNEAGEVTHLVGAIQDITDRHKYEEELERLATNDSLTSLPNRRTFDERFHVEIARARRHARPLSLAVLDLDRFKRINDTLGHPVGDRVLAEVADRLRGVMRNDELIARVGGEEFAWILPDADTAGAVAAVERARRAIGGEPFGEAGIVTVSGGVCELREGLDSVSLYREADSALLAAKQAGRDRIVSVGPSGECTVHAGYPEPRDPA